MKSYIENVAYQDLTAAVAKAHETLESIKLDTKTAEQAVKAAKKDGKSKFEISLLQLALRQQKLEEESQRITQKVAELEKDQWVSSFKKDFKKAENEEKEAVRKIEKEVKEAFKKAAKEEKEASKSSKKHLKVTVNGENLDIEVEPKKAKTPKVKKIKVIVIESPELASTEPAPTEPEKVEITKVKKIKVIVEESPELASTDTAPTEPEKVKTPKVKKVKVVADKNIEPEQTDVIEAEGENK